MSDHQPKRIAMVAYSAYESDNRVMRYAEALVQRGDQVEVFAIAGGPGRPRQENIRGVQVYRLQTRVKNEKGKLSYLFRILPFLLTSFLTLSWKHLRSRYHVVHVHNVPDFLVFSALLPRLTGSRIILDIHDILPEFFGSKFGVDSRNPYLRLLKLVEKISCGFAHHVIISNHLWFQTITSRSVAAEKCSVMINYVDTSIFFPHKRTRSDDRLIALFPGGLQWHQGLDIAIRAFRKVRECFENAELHIYGEGSMKPTLIHQTTELGLSAAIRFFEPVRLVDIPGIMANADLGIVPKRADSFGNEAYSTKIMEFMSQAVPVVASRTRIDSFYFDESVLSFFESGNDEELASKIIHLFSEGRKATELGRRGLEYVNKNNWEQRKQNYFAIVDNTVAPTMASNPSLESLKCTCLKA